MGVAAGCCLQRDADAAHPAPPLLQRDAFSANDVLAAASSSSPSKRKERQRLSKQQSLDMEWDIIAKSIQPEELERLRTFRRRVMDCDTHPACIERMLSCQPQTLLRFLRGRDGDLDKAEAMFRASLNWRCSFQVDQKVRAWQQELTEGKSPKARVVLRYGFDGQPCLDQYGVPVWLMRLGAGDPAGLVRELGEEAVLIERLSKMEAMHAELRKAMFRNSTLIRGCVQVIDVGDYREQGIPNWWSRMFDGFKLGRDSFRIFEANYPETTRKIFFVRMGQVTHSIYKLALPIIPPRTKQKMRFFGAKAESWRQELQDELLAGEVLPPFLRTNTSEAFAAATPKGGIVPVGSGRGASFPTEQKDEATVLRRRSFADGAQHVPSAKFDRSKTLPALPLPSSRDAAQANAQTRWLLLVLLLGFLVIVWIVASTAATELQRSRQQPQRE